MDWNRGYACAFELRRVNPRTWADADPVAGLASATVTRDSGGDVPLLESGSFEVDNASFAQGWHRLNMVTTQDGVVELWPIATLLLESGEQTHDRGVVTVRADGRSVLQPAADRLITVGTYAPMGSDGAAYAAQLIADCTPAPVAVEGSFTLDSHYVFEPGSSHLQCAWSLLDAANWCIRISGDGTVMVSAKPDVPALSLDKANAASVMPGSTLQVDWSGVPNRYYAVDGGERAVAVNDSGGPASYAERGRYVDVYDDAVTRVGGETLDSYAKRKLAERSTVLCKVNYTREYRPDVAPFDMVRSSIERLGAEGDLRVFSQTLTCGNGLTVEETSGWEVRGYDPWA